MSLQTIAYGRGNFVRGAISEIFPESDLPRLGEISHAVDGLFEVVSLRNDREHYARTCREWLGRLQKKFEEATRLVGKDAVRHFEVFLDASARGFDWGIFVLYRLSLRRLDEWRADPLKGS
jgi:cyclopropane-fatty-acyl-phospholipid synthase